MQNKITIKKSNKIYKIQVDGEWRQRIIDKQNDYFTEYPNLKKLKEKIESFAYGTLYNPTFETEEEVGKMINEGKLFGKTFKMAKGRPSSCHENSCLLYLLQKKDISPLKKYNFGEVDIYTGYALSDDGLWRQHTWCVGKEGDFQGKPIETTVRREKYFGYCLEGEELEEFIDSNTF